MKKNLCFLCLVFACSFTSAQLTVNPNGNVAVKSDATPLSAISINGAGSTVSDIFVESTDKGIIVRRTGTLPMDKTLTKAATPKDEEASKYTDTIIPELHQNAPNPFTENTEISFCIPKEAKAAALYIYDMNGKQVDEVVLSQRGEGMVTLQGSHLEAGMYLYSLIIDGKLIDVKRMVLTK